MTQHGRAPWFEPADLEGEVRELYDRITTGPRARGPQAFPLADDAGRLHGPFNALLLSPKIGTALQELGSTIRYATAFTPRQREIAILELSAERRCAFEWYAHAAVGRLSGLTEAEVEALLDRRDAPTFTPAEALVRGLVRVLLRERNLDDGTFDRAVETLGAPGLMELIALVGYYDLLALSLAVWRAPLPDGTESAFS